MNSRCMLRIPSFNIIRHTDVIRIVCATNHVDMIPSHETILRTQRPDRRFSMQKPPFRAACTSHILMTQPLLRDTVVAPARELMISSATFRGTLA